MDAETAVARTVLCERQARDRGWWDQLEASFRPAAAVILSWIDGPARPDEVAALYEHLYAWLRTQNQQAGRPPRGEIA